MKEANHMATTNKLLLILVIPVVFYVLKLLSFIFIPLVAALFIALLFMPLMRWSYKKNIHRSITLTAIGIFLFALIRTCIALIKLSSNEISHAGAVFWNDIFAKISVLLLPVLEMLGFEYVASDTSLQDFLHSEKLGNALFENMGTMIAFVQSASAMFLIAIFFIILLLAGSVNIQKLMEETIFQSKFPSIRTLIIIERSIVKFLIVKFLISLATGISFGIACYLFGIKFPLFWGLLAFGLNFIQMVGSIISTALLAFFSMAQLDHTGTLVAFILIIIGVQILFGSILEPVFMGKTFSINTITILFMLMLWGFLWGVPGLILAVPLTVVLKTVFEQFPRTQIIARIMS
jgi:predicted PurR-regulated permease PerM